MTLRVQGPDQALFERCGPSVVEWNGVLRCRDKIKDISPSSNSSPSVTVVRIVADNVRAQVNARLEVKSHSRKRPISRGLSLAQSDPQDEHLSVLKNLYRNDIL